MSASSRVEPARVVERYPRRVRWFHAGVYAAVLLLMLTGLWLTFGQEGNPSPLSSLTGKPDTRLHVWIGWAFAGLLAVGILLGARGLGRFLRDSVTFGRGDAAWLARWPLATFTGRFPRHEGRYDPGQRIANLAIVALLVAVVGSGIAMALLHGGPAYTWLVPVHRWSTFLLVPLLAGHILIASGLLPGYRGVWRSMHLGGRLDERVARRLWPGWLDRRSGG